MFMHLEISRVIAAQRSREIQANSKASRQFAEALGSHVWSCSDRPVPLAAPFRRPGSRSRVLVPAERCPDSCRSVSP